MRNLNLKNITKKDAFDTCLRALQNLNIEKAATDFEKGFIQGKKEFSLLSFGEIISIQLTELGGTKIKIDITSESKGMQVFDWGTNEENEKNISNEIRIILNLP